MIKIALVIMVKDEEKRILTTLKSIKNQVDGIVMLDTGSTDETISISKNFALENNLPFHLKKKTFQDFSTTRNIMLKFAKKFDYTHLFLLDCNDELKCGSFQNFKSCNDDNEEKKCKHDNLLRSLIQENSTYKIFLLKQQWYTGSETINFYNIRLIQNNIDIEYKGSVHEYLDAGSLPHLKTDNVLIFQDRVLDNDGKTSNRWESDLKLLLRDIKKNPTCSRTCFYLAQTYECLKDDSNTFIWYKNRTTMNGFLEEKFLSFLKCAKYETDTDKKILWYLKSLEIFQDRAEPFLEISRIYRSRDHFFIAYHFASIACSLEFPKNCILFVNKKIYNHDRWQELSINSFYIDKFDEGYNACLKAIESGYDMELNQKNLSFYKEKMGFV